MHRSKIHLSLEEGKENSWPKILHKCAITEGWVEILFQPRNVMHRRHRHHSMMVAGELRQLDPWGPGSQSLTLRLNQENRDTPVSTMRLALLANNTSLLLGSGQDWGECYSVWLRHGRSATVMAAETTEKNPLFHRHHNTQKGIAAHHWKNLKSAEIITMKPKSISSPE